MSRRRPVEDMYPLTPMQEGMLFHTLYAPDSGVYFQQVSATIRGAIDAGVFERVWQTLVDRHPVLRTSFVWDRRAPPFQVVHREARLPWTYEDWRGLPHDEQQARLVRWLHDDRRRGFALDRPPLMRVALLRLDDDRSQVVWSHHHLLLDGWSVPLILGELVALYDALLAGAAPSLPARRPYRDFVAWLRETADDGACERFWRGQIGDLEGPTALASATAAGGHADESTAMAEHTLRLSEDDTAALQRFARDHQLTLNTLAQGAWAIVLSRSSGDQRVVFGATVSGRPPELPGADTMVGLFINTLPVRVHVPADARVVEWLADLQAQLVAARRFEHTPLTSTHGWSEVPREVPLFESLVVFENYPVDPEQSARSTGLTIEHADSHERTNYPLTLVVVPGRELILKADYDTRSFDAASIASLLSRLARVLTGLTRTASGCLAHVPWLAADERRRVVTEWNRTMAPPAALVHERFAEQAGATPSAVAIREGARTVTFGALADRVNRVARRLVELGVGPDERVAIALPPGADAIVAMLAVLEAGGAYVPVDPAYPAARKRFVIEDAKVRLVIGEGGDEAMAGSVPWVNVAAPDDTAPDDTVSRRAARVAGDNLAYVIYTSGSTGQPKGAMVTHRGLANYLAWAIDAYGVATGSGAPLHTPLGFDLTVTSIFPPLLTGRTIDVIPVGDGVEPLATRLAESPDYGLVKITPAHLEVLAHLLPASQAAGSTRALVIGGEALTEDQLAFWRAHAPATRLINEYGPTETVVGCCVHDATHETSANGVVPIGRPIANTRLYVLDRMGGPVPVGVAGELFIGGAGVARGYAGRPDLTAERFVPDPFGDEPGARLYRTGDRARYREDGVIEFLGRLDDQVKVRGFRIEPGEIEVVLRRHPEVEECAVVVQPAPGGPRLVAFVVATAGAATSHEAWREFLAQELPAHMIPTTFEAVNALPLTANGKVDRRALMSRSPQADEGRRSSPPRGAAEELVASIWADVLGRADIGRDDTFFELGGHSLLATRIIARARAAFGLDVPLRTIFDAPTVARFAAQLDAQRRDGDATPGVPLVRRAGGAEAPLSFAQQRLWFLHQLDPANAAYNIRYAVRLIGPLDASALEASLDAIAQRHEVLRARFETVAGRPHQVVEPMATIPVARHDLRAQTAEARAVAVRAIADEDARRPFDLARGPLMRATLVQLGDREALLHLAMHHIVSDAWSVEILVREIAACYEARARNLPVSLPALPIQYADYAAWQRASLQGATRDRHLEYWRRQLADVPVLDLPTDKPRPAVRSFAGASLSFDVPPALAARVDTLGRAEGATPFMILLAAFQILLARHAGQDDLAIGTPVASRPRQEVEGLIGFFMNTLVLRARFTGGTSFRRWLAQVRETTLGAFAHQDLPFEQIVDELAPSRDLGQNPLFQVMFTTTAGEPMPLAVGELRLTPVPLDTSTAKFDLSLSLARAADGLSGTFEYSAELFEPETVQRLAEQYFVLLEQAVASPDRAIDALSLLTPASRADVVSMGNRTRVDHGEHGTVVDLFEAQVARSPGAVAVQADGGPVTFAELDRRATLVGAGLRARGIGVDEVVGLCVDRGVDLVVGMLGILKSGAAYVPLDRTYPPDRLTFMQRDSGARLVIVDAAGREALGQACPGATVQQLEAVGRDSVNPVRASSRLDAALAYVIYTSGSTGWPKGTMVPHRALRNHMAWMQREFPLGPDDRVLQKTPISFDASVWEFYAPLLSGARLVMARPGGHHDVEYLADASERHGITVLQVVPSLLRMLLDAGGLASCRSLRRVFAGGEALTGELRDRLFATLDCELHNLYGPTEATIDTVTWSCRRGETHRLVPIGRPIDNTTAYVLDTRLEPVPVGVVGELVLGGLAVGRGYLGQPAATADRFVPDPFGAEPGGRLYRTGDRVRRRAGGELEFLGRLDGQVKIRGMRIELGEIDAVLASHPAVREVAALVRDDRPGVRRIVAWYAPRPGSSIDGAELRAFARQRLPDHMTPALFVALDDLPRLPNGKIDRRALPAPGDDATAPEATFVAPRNPVEATLATIWAEVVGRSRVGVRDNFFEIGGDSILSLQVVSRARATGLSLTPADLFRHQTIEALAAVADRAAEAPVLAPETGREVPLTPIQHWFFEQDLPSPHHWNQALMLVATGGVAVPALERALASVVASHDVLTLGFAHGTDGWRQAVMVDEPRVPVEHIDFSAVPAGQRDQAVREAADRLQASFALHEPPLMRVALFDLGADEPARVLVVLHHLIVDAVSWQILLEDLARDYDAIARGEAAPAPLARTVSFAAWSAALVRHARSAAVAREREYWLDAGQAVIRRLPVDCALAPGDNDEASAAWIEQTLERGETDTLLHEIASVYNTQTLDLLLTALVETVGTWTGDRRALVDLEGHGREEFVPGADVSRTVGWFTTIYPVAFDLEGVPSGGAALKHVKERLRAVPQHGLGYGLIRYLGADRAVRDALRSQPAAEISFNYLGQVATTTGGARWRAVPDGVGRLRGNGPRRHLVEVVATVIDSRLQVRWIHGRAHAPETVGRLADRYVEVLRSLIAHCTSREAGGYTPSDFTAAAVSQRDLDKLVARLRQ